MAVGVMVDREGLTERRRTLLVVAAALLGGGIGSLLGFWWGRAFMEPPCEVALLARVLGSIGAFVAGLWEAILGAFWRRSVGAVVAAFSLWMMTVLCLWLPAVLYTAAQPCPSPRPYSGLFGNMRWPYPVETIHGGGGWHSRTETYYVTLSIDDLQQHYEHEMDRFCEDSPQLESSRDPQYSDCAVTYCTIRSGADPHLFWVYICPSTEGRWRVVHVDMWEFD
jgi:hypothetical protein